MVAHIVNNAQKAASADKMFCDFPPAVADALEQEAITTTYPTGAVLFAEGQAPRGIFIVRPSSSRRPEFWRLLLQLEFCIGHTETSQVPARA